jgi:pectin methylesterase-like acyl-CoA thioesterase
MFWDDAEKETSSIPTTRSRNAQTRSLNCVFAAFARAVDAAENLSISFNAVPDNPAIAMRANRRQRMDGALETVESVLPAADHFKRLVIFVVANLTYKPYTNVSRAERLAAVFSFTSN